ncbi:helix-turn-helix transcriptional regulator [Shewanella sp. WXL01]|uniref:helix-turn-helix domain-containing protein n=1 Tax=Shewanella sp. WXL01 TaxID=2709721 RepID=UPI00143835E1|nr:AraC family transcriptional regulator [Shewanella sp. WXL01]NKF49954.1 helix-turn-helix transcriptional regulator [Shewanella sp. WXL01]
MKSNLKFFDYDSKQLSNCGEVLNIELSSEPLNWQGVALEKGASPHFYPQNVYTPYFYFALALDKDLTWSAMNDGNVTPLQTTPGDIWINPPATPFTHNIDEPCYFIILAIEEQTLLANCPLNLQGKQLNFLNNYNVHDDVIKGLMELFLLELRNKGRNGSVYLNNLISLLAIHYIQNYSNYADLQTQQNDASKFDQAQISKIDAYIDANISEAITVDDLAELLNCSKFYFLREFKKLMGNTPYQYLMSKRLELAKQMLGNNNASISIVGQEVGFNDQSHFTRAFKSQFGITPNQFLKGN